jgi:hypothetical protein
MGSQVPFGDDLAVSQSQFLVAVVRGVLDARPQIVQITGSELGTEDRVADTDPVCGAREGQDVEAA